MTLRSILSHHKEQKASRKELRLGYRDRRAVEIRDPSDEIVDRIQPQFSHNSQVECQSADGCFRSRTWSDDESVNSHRASTVSLTSLDWSYDTPSCFISPNPSTASTISRNLSTTSSHCEQVITTHPSRPRPFSYAPCTADNFSAFDSYSPPQQALSPCPSIRRKHVALKRHSISEVHYNPTPDIDTHMSASLTSPFTMDNPYGEYISSPVQKSEYQPVADPQDAETGGSRHEECTSSSADLHPHVRLGLALIPEED